MERPGRIPTEYVIENELASIVGLLDELVDMLTHWPMWTPPQALQIRLALDEAITNAVYHGNLEVGSNLEDRDDFNPESLANRRRRQDMFASRRVVVRARVTESSACYLVEDEGPGFDPDDVPDPIADENILKFSGRGLVIIRSVMDIVRFNEKGNRIEMIKTCADEESPENMS